MSIGDIATADGSPAASPAGLAESEARLRAFLRATSDIVYRMSADWSVMLELDGQGAIADTVRPRQSWRDQYHFPEDGPIIGAAIARAIETRSVFELEHRVVRVDGSVGWVHSRAVPILDEAGEIVEWFGAAADITARKAAEDATLDRLAELEHIYATAPIGMALLSPDLVFLRINERLAEMNGRPAAAHIGRSVGEMVPDLAPQVAAIRDGFLAGGGPTLKEFSGETPAQPGVTRYWEERWSPLRDASGGLQALSVVVEEITERKAAELQRERLVNELNHRVKNTLAIVQSLARRSFRGEGDPAARVAGFEGRLASLAVAHNILTRTAWRGADLLEVVRGALAPFAGEAVSIKGPPVTLAPAVALNLAVILHELGANATKYGALSEPDGRVGVAWTISDDGRLELVWREADGPPVVAPTRTGFGSRLIAEALRGEPGGGAALRFDPAGVVCEITLQLTA
jgi:PAS domain S-box-containing protein